MWTISETNNLRNALKMKLANYSWYLSSQVIPGFEGYSIQVDVSKINGEVLRVVPSRMRRTLVKIQVRTDS